MTQPIDQDLAEQIAAAEAAGYTRAVDLLRELGRPWDADIPRRLADWLESEAGAGEGVTQEQADQKARIAEYIRTVESSRVARSDLGEVVVSTMWVGADPKRRRIETMILGGPHDGYTVDHSYADESEARLGHATVVDALRAGRTPDGLAL